MRVMIILLLLSFSLNSKEGFDRENCQWVSRDLRTMAFRLSNISWNIERKCRQNSTKGQEMCVRYMQYFEEILNEMNGQLKVVKERCMK